MKTLRIPLAFALGLTTTWLAGAGPFTAGNLVIYRVGDGTLDLTNRGNVVFLDEYTTNGVLVQSLMLPTNAVGAQHPLIASGTAISEGLLTRSTDGRYLLFTGYGTNLTSGLALASTAATDLPRVVGRVDAAGNLDTTTALTNFSTGNNPRSAASDNGVNLWVGGGAGGMAYTTLGSTAVTTVSTTPVSNIRQVAIFGGQLYLSTSSGSTVRIGAVGTGLPTSGPVTTTSLPGLPTSGGGPYAFVLLNLTGGADLDTLYVADETYNAILKYSLVSGSWVSNGVIAASNVRGLTAVANISGGTTNVHLYGTTGGSTAAGGGSLYAATDTAGHSAPPSMTNATVVVTAAARTAFRGIAFAPVAPTAPPQITALEIVGNDVRVTWTAVGGTTNYVQAVSTANGNLLPSGFADISGPISIHGSGPVVTNYLEVDARTNQPDRYYRIRIAP